MKKNSESSRILILLENHIYPNDVRVQPHAESLAEQGYKVTVISPGGKGYSNYEVINGVNIYRYPVFLLKQQKRAMPLNI